MPQRTELFNTAVLNGHRVTSEIETMAVYSWHEQSDRSVNTPDACSADPAARQVLDVQKGGGKCSAVLTDRHTQGDDTVIVTIYEGEHSSQVRRIYDVEQGWTSLIWQVE